jgi:hypothetical protein
MYLAVSELAPRVENVVSIVVYETFAMGSFNEHKEADIVSDVESNPQGGFNGLQATGGSVHEVFVGVVPIYVHLPRTCEECSNTIGRVLRQWPLLGVGAQDFDRHGQRPPPLIDITGEV